MKKKSIFLFIVFSFLFHSGYSQSAPIKRAGKKTAQKPELVRALPGVSTKKLLEIPKDTLKKVAPKKPKGLTRVLFIFDDSQSMMGQWQSGAKIDIAKKLLGEILDSLKKEENLELAFRVYGHQKRYPPKDCDDTKLEVPFAKNNIDKIKQKLNSLVPKGTTPIALSLEACANDFPKSTSRNIVILITDGLEECEGDPCAVSKALQSKGIILKPFIIGIGNVAENLKQLECVGSVYDAANEKTFKNVMNIVISQALNNTTAQVNLLDINEKPTETNVNMTFYELQKGIIKYNFMHTINSRGNPDTLKIDPLLLYKIIVHTIPPVLKDSVRLNPGKHNIIGIDAPQGHLLLSYDERSDFKQVMAIVRKNKEMNTLNVQAFNTKEKYIVGKYDLEILTLPRILVKDVEISQSKTTTVKIDSPGLATIVSTTPGYGSIYLEDTNKLTWVYNLNDNLQKETLLLQPGNYKVVFRSKSAKETIYTIEKSFKVSSGASSNINLQ
jgi:Ca-activated chloride channel homolog